MISNIPDITFITIVVRYLQVLCFMAYILHKKRCSSIAIVNNSFISLVEIINNVNVILTTFLKLPLPKNTVLKIDKLISFMNGFRYINSEYF